MAAAKAFGNVPTNKVFVRIQQIQGGRAVETKSYNVFGSDLDTVATAVEEKLSERFGNGEEEIEEEEEEIEEPVVRRKKKAGRR